MHELVFYAAVVWMTALAFVCITVVVRADSPMVRILALDTLTLVLVALLVLFAASNRVAYYLDAALLLALLSFISTLAAARYHGEGKLF